MLESLLNMETIDAFFEGENGEKMNQIDACWWENENANYANR